MSNAEIPRERRHPAQAVDSPNRERYRQHRQSSGGRSSGKNSRRVKELHKCRRRKLILKIILGLMTLALVATILLAKIYSGKAAKEHARALSLVQAQTSDSPGENSEVIKLRSQIAALVAGRIPGLNKLVFDEVISIDDRYVKNVLFSESRRGGESLYEYKLKLHNTGSNIVEPKIDIYLFSAVGLQIGIGSSKGVDDAVLIPDETRSYDADIELSLEGKPEFYMIKVY